jgi:hypothetical protein
MTREDNSRNRLMITETSRLAETFSAYATGILRQDQSFPDRAGTIQTHAGTIQITARNALARMAAQATEGHA